MTKLEFPTMAEKAIAEWDHRTAFATFAKRRGAFSERTWEGWRYFFDDDSRVFVRGTGKNHTMTAELP